MLFEKWCGFTTRLERFFKDKARCEIAFTLSPHLSPRRGYPVICNRPLFTAFCRGLAAWRHPRLRSVYWLARRTNRVCRARQKPPSSLTRKRVHGRTGWNEFCAKRTICPLWLGRVKTGFELRVKLCQNVTAKGPKTCELLARFRGPLLTPTPIRRDTLRS